MPGDRDLRVRLRADGESDVKRAIDGTVSKATAAAQTQAKAQRDASQAIERTVAERARAEDRAVKHSVNEVRRAERDKQRAAEQTVRRGVEQAHRAEQQKRAEFTRTARSMEREQRRAERGRSSRGGGGGRNPGISGDDIRQGFASRIGPAALGAAGLAGVQQMLSELVSQQMSVIRAVEQRAGVQDIGERTVTAQDFDLELARMGGEVFGDVSADQRQRELAAVRAEIVALAQATNQEPGQLLDALGTLQTEFSAFDFGRENLRALGDEATRTGSEVGQLARFAGLVRQQFGEGLDVNTMLDIAAQGGLQGALTPEQLSSEFASQLGVFRSLVDPNETQSAEASFRQFVATANVVRSSGLNAAESSTATQNMLAALADDDVQARIALATGGRFRGRRTVNGRRVMRVSGGVQLQDFRDENGQLDLAGYTEALAEREDFGSLESLRTIEGLPQQAAVALNAIVKRRRAEVRGVEDNADLRELMNVDAGAGRAFRTTNLAEVKATDAELARAEGIRGQVEGIDRGAERGGEAVEAVSLRESLRQEGAAGRLIADNDTLSWLAAQVQDSPIGEALQNPMVSAVGSMFAGGVINQAAGVSDPITALSNAFKTENMRDAMREALRSGVIDVRVTNPEDAPGGGAEPRRSQSPRERTGR